jgi:uncharacterized protein YggE
MNSHRGAVSFTRLDLAALLALLLALPPAAPGPLRAQQDGPKPRTLSVSGEGMIQVKPERARVRVGVVTEAKTARAASEENAQKMSRVVEALRSAGIAAEKIQTVQLTIEPAYDYTEPGKPPVLRGFLARNVVEATTAELAGVGEVLDVVIGVGGNTVEGIAFELEDPGAAQAEALARAVTDARRKAETLARAAGLELGEIQEISAAQGGGPMPVFARGVALMEARADAAPPVSPGELTVTSSVHVVYRIE